MVLLHIAVIDGTAMAPRLKKIVKGAKDGVKLATEEGVLWIHQSVFSGQEHVGDANYPDVTPVTKKIKASAGKELVGIWTGHTKASFNSAVSGLEGKITGSVYEYFGSKWHIDSLFFDKHAKKTREIIEKAVKDKI